jgi:UPF0271 protein
MTFIDLNADVGELPERILDGTQERLMQQVTSVNVSCGAHAGDDQTLIHTLEIAKTLKLFIGAHPSYPDLKSFGRNRMNLSPVELSESIRQQLEHLFFLAEKVGVKIRHVKPHGALYNVAADDVVVAKAICDGVSQVDRNLVLIGLASSKMIEIFSDQGFQVINEAFVDRRYEDNARLRSRELPDSVIADPNEVLGQALSLVLEKRVRTASGNWVEIDAQTLCLHGDAPGAADLARIVRERLMQEEVNIGAGCC